MSIEISLLTEQDIPGVVECVQKGFADDPYFQWVFDSKNFSKKRNYTSLRNRCLWGINNGLFYVAREVPTTSPSSSTVEHDAKVPISTTTTACKSPVNITSNPRSSTSSSAGSFASPSQSDQPSTPRVVGVSMWLPPHPASKPMSWYSYTQSWLLSFRQLLTNIRYLGRGGLNVNRYHIWKAKQRQAQADTWTDSRGYYFCNVVSVLPEMHGRGIGRKLVEVVTDQADREGMSCYLESSKEVPNIRIYEKLGFVLAGGLDCDDNGAVCKLYCMTRDPKPPKS